MRGSPGSELPFLFMAAFRTMVDEAHRRLAEQGHPGVRPAHGFAMQAVGEGASASEVARQLGVSKQAAAKTIERLVELGYVTQAVDPADARRKLVTPTSHGRDMLHRSAVVFDEIYGEWSNSVGAGRLERLHEDLARLTGDRALRVDGPGRMFGPD